MGICSSYEYDWLDKDYEPKNLPEYVPKISIVKCIKVYDGDTITIAARFNRGEPVYKFSIRLLGIDSPELRTSDSNEKTYAKKSRDRLSELILNKVIVLKNVATGDKFGRILADVWIDKIHVNKWMIDNKLAVKYNGGTKQQFNLLEYENDL